MSNDNHCEVPECGSPRRRRGRCSKHDMQFRRHGHKPGFVFDAHLLEVYCAFPECGQIANRKGLCVGHYGQQVKTGRLSHINRGGECPVLDCTNPGGARRRLCFDHATYARRYGFSEDVVVRLFADRRCYNPGCDGRDKLHLDHDHTCCPTGKMCVKCVRGWLCSSCNIALGSLREDRQRILGLARYLDAGDRITL